MNLSHRIATALASIALCASADAASVFSNDFHGAEQATDTSIATSFNAVSGAASAVFYVDGFGSLDGDDYWIDIFSLTLNGQQVLSGTWSMTGGGADRLISAPAGATYTSYGDFVGISVPLMLAAGLNTLTFSYASPTTFEGVARGGFQGLSDEGWGLGTVDVTQEVTAVPEPQSLALLLAGLGLLGAALARRQSPAR